MRSLEAFVSGQRLQRERYSQSGVWFRRKTFLARVPLVERTEFVNVVVVDERSVHHDCTKCTA